MASPRNPYSVLNVAPDAETVVIEAAYRALMKKYHPDQGAAGGQGAASAAEINAAFALLRDPQRRADYDHREWTRVQAIQLAQYQPPPSVPRRSNFFGWGGWLVALVLAGAIGVIAGQNGGVPPLPKAEMAKAASLAAPDFRSQPTVPKVPPAELAEIRADALLGRSATPVDSDATPPPRAPHRVHAPPHRHGAAAAAAEKDFVERHGGIY